MTPEQKDTLMQREIGRRVWSALTSQDWLCSTSQGMYTQQKRHYTSILPRHFDEETWEPVVNYQKPTFTHISNYLNEIAHVLVRYLDDMMDAGDIDSKYNVVLRYDAIMRGLCIEKMPPWLSLNTPYNDAWPEWTNAKTVLEAMEERLPKEPQWWVEQAFVVTAGLCLGLDLFHRSEGEPEAIKDLEAIHKAVTILEQWPTSSVAAHGIRLLTTLLQEHSKKNDATRADSRAKEPDLPPNIAPQALAHDASVDSPKPSEAPPPPREPIGHPDVPVGEEVWVNTDFDIDMIGFEELMETLPLQNGFDNSVFLDSLWNGYTV
ncbi:transcription elongation factor spt5 [Paraconiothyrium brasiliense]|uniref:Transcription elongation factor spt5 n=1 Tax=Paraconiothyrium brasiliense TaxID=300254 RepID=A0ABR3S935_9PLEO